ncbi:MAG: hypothetical protein MHM6MM_005101 [Cercozoa sp. M6MM]
MGPTSFQVTQHNDSDANILKPLTTVLFKTSDTVSGRMLAPMVLCLLVLSGSSKSTQMASQFLESTRSVTRQPPPRCPGVLHGGMRSAMSGWSLRARALCRCCIVFSRPSATREQLCQLNETHRPSGSVWFVVARRVAVFVDAVVPRTDASCRRSCWRASYGRGRM